MEINRINPDVNILNKDQLGKLLGELELPKKTKPTTKNIAKKSPSAKPAEKASVSEILKDNFIEE